MTPKEKAAIALEMRYEKGRTYEEISQHLDKGISWVRDVCKGTYHADVRPDITRIIVGTVGRLNITKKMIQKMEKLKAQGLNNPEVAKKMGEGITAQHVYYHTVHKKK